MAAPTYSDLNALLRKPVTEERGNAAIEVVTGLVRAYTRDQGFTSGVPNADLRSVIITASLRLCEHPTQIRFGISKGPQSATYGDGFTGWSTAERACLNRYRQRAE